MSEFYSASLPIQHLKANTKNMKAFYEPNKIEMKNMDLHDLIEKI